VEIGFGDGSLQYYKASSDSASEFVEYLSAYILL